MLLLLIIGYSHISLRVTDLNLVQPYFIIIDLFRNHFDHFGTGNIRDIRWYHLAKNTWGNPQHRLQIEIEIKRRGKAKLRKETGIK